MSQSRSSSFLTISFRDRDTSQSQFLVDHSLIWCRYNEFSRTILMRHWTLRLLPCSSAFLRVRKRSYRIFLRRSVQNTSARFYTTVHTVVAQVVKICTVGPVEICTVLSRPPQIFVRHKHFQNDNGNFFVLNFCSLDQHLSSQYMGISMHHCRKDAKVAARRKGFTSLERASTTASDQC